MRKRRNPRSRKPLTDSQRDMAAEHGRTLSQAYERLFPHTADRLWVMRQTLNMTQKQMGEECGLSASVIGNVERGYNLPMGRSLVKIGAKLGISADYILNLSKKPKIS